MATKNAGTSASQIRDNGQNDARFARVFNNLSDLGNAEIARSNLGLGSAATRVVGTASGDRLLDRDQLDARFLPLDFTPSPGSFRAYAMVRNLSGGVLNTGDLVAGSGLRYSDVSGSVGSIPSGTWRTMSRISADGVGLCQRVV